MEEWKGIYGYEGLYSVSNYGKVRNDINNRVLVGCDNGSGYKKVQLFNGKSKKKFYIHRLVALAFVPNPNGFKEVNHIDFVHDNNRADNLEWVNSSQNKKHAVYSKVLKPWNNEAKPVKAINIVTGEVTYFPTISSAEKKIGSRHIIDVIKGRRNVCKGFTFSYAEGGDPNAYSDYRISE